MSYLNASADPAVLSNSLKAAEVAARTIERTRVIHAVRQMAMDLGNFTALDCKAG